MEKEKIDARDKEFRDVLKEIRMHLAMRQVQAEKKESKPRNRFKIAIPVLAVVLVVAVFFVGKTMRSRQPVVHSVPEQIRITVSQQPVPATQPESDETLLTKEQNGGSLGEDFLITESEKELTNQRASLSGSHDAEDKEPFFETYLEADSEVGNGKQLKNEAAYDEMINGEKTDPGPESAFNEYAEPEETLRIESAIPPAPLSDGSFSLYGTRINQHLVCAAVKARNCDVPQTVFSLNTNRNPHVWMEVFSDSVPYLLKHVYYHEGRKYVEVSLKIEYRRMRTWSYITLNNPNQLGSWHVETVSDDGRVMARAEFFVTSGR